jgi:hypothetical protein
MYSICKYKAKFTYVYWFTKTRRGSRHNFNIPLYLKHWDTDGRTICSRSIYKACFGMSHMNTDAKKHFISKRRDKEQRIKKLDKINFTTETDTNCDAINVDGWFYMTKKCRFFVPLRDILSFRILPCLTTWPCAQHYNARVVDSLDYKRLSLWFQFADRRQ